MFRHQKSIMATSGLWFIQMGIHTGSAFVAGVAWIKKTLEK
jgi:hypothetical protein